jgi:hypothetical protein
MDYVEIRIGSKSGSPRKKTSVDILEGLAPGESSMISDCIDMFSFNIALELDEPFLKS